MMPSTLQSELCCSDWWFLTEKFKLKEGKELHLNDYLTAHYQWYNEVKLQCQVGEKKHLVCLPVYPTGPILFYIKYCSSTNNKITKLLKASISFVQMLNF